MKVAILHHDLEWTEHELKRILKEKFNSDVEMFDIRMAVLEDFRSFNPDLILNRVYASVANRDYNSLKKTLSLLRSLDETFLIVNSFNASLADYSKYHSFNLMKSVNIRTPNTKLYDENYDIQSNILGLGNFPLIVKRDTGGRGVDLRKCNNLKEVEYAINNIKSSEDYTGGIIFQEFHSPMEGYDYRVWIVGGEVILYHKRTLISSNGEAPWLASRSLGSKILPPEVSIPEDLKEFSRIAAESIGAEFDVLDVIKTEEGYSVIEHNPTPNVRPEYEGILGFNVLEKLIESIRKKYLRMEVVLDGSNN